MRPLSYKGYVASLEYDAETRMMRGQIINTASHIDFYCADAAKIEEELKTSVDEYLAVCAERGIEPEKPYSGRLNLRMTPGLHARAAAAAKAQGKSLNVWLIEAIEKSVDATDYIAVS